MSIRTKTLLALIEKPGHVCFRYRVAAFEPALAEAGWRLEAEAVEHGCLASVHQLRSAARADAVLLQRRLLSWWRIRLLRRFAKYLIFDIDDAVFHRDSNNPRGPESSSRLRRFAATVKRADAILAGNAFLADQSRRFASPERVHEFPTCVDASLYEPRTSERSGGETRLVWIGSRSTMTSLDGIREGLAEATRRLPGLKLRVVCDAFPKLAGVEVVPVSWTESTEAEELAGADIGVSWLPEHPWSLGKCGLKVLQYMAAGLPVVANPFGVHPSMVSAETGILARSPFEWADAIMKLASDPQLRRRLGSDARRRLEVDYSVRAWGRKFASCLESPIRDGWTSSIPRD